MESFLIARRRRSSSAALSSNDGFEFSIAKAVDIVCYRRVDSEGLGSLAVQPIPDLLGRVQLPLFGCGHDLLGYAIKALLILDSLENRAPQRLTP